MVQKPSFYVVQQEIWTSAGRRKIRQVLLLSELGESFSGTSSKDSRDADIWSQSNFDVSRRKRQKHKVQLKNFHKNSLWRHVESLWEM